MYRIRFHRIGKCQNSKETEENSVINSLWMYSVIRVRMPIADTHKLSNFLWKNWLPVYVLHAHFVQNTRCIFCSNQQTVCRQSTKTNRCKIDFSVVSARKSTMEIHAFATWFIHILSNSGKHIFVEMCGEYIFFVAQQCISCKRNIIVDVDKSGKKASEKYKNTDDENKSENNEKDQKREE